MTAVRRRARHRECSVPSRLGASTMASASTPDQMGKARKEGIAPADVAAFHADLGAMTSAIDQLTILQTDGSRRMASDHASYALSAHHAEIFPRICEFADKLSSLPSKRTDPSSRRTPFSLQGRVLHLLGGDPELFAAACQAIKALDYDSPSRAHEDESWPEPVNRYRPDDVISRDALALLHSAMSIVKARLGEEEDLVTLDQMAAHCRKGKRSLERCLQKGEIPRPDVPGGGGASSRWRWSKVRGPLAMRFGLALPEKFPRLR